MSRFRSRLLWKAFFSVLLGLLIWLPVFYWLTVPLIDRLAYQVEEQAARNVLNDVSQMIGQSHRDLEAWRQSMLDGHRREMKSIVTVVQSWASQMEAEVSAGKISRAEARRQFLEKLRNLRYGNNDYLWAADYDSTFVAHPEAAFQGRSALDFRDYEGKPLIPAMVRQARLAGEGYFSYRWERLGGKAAVDKIGYVRDFPTWGLVVGTGVYVDDVTEEGSQRKAAMIDDLRRHLRNIKVAGSGYVSVVDGSGRVVIHPDSRIEGSLLGKIINPASGMPLVDDIKGAANLAEKTIDYRWGGLEDPAGQEKPKLAWVHHFPEYDWYLMASAYSDDLGRNGQQLNERILIAFVLGIVITTLVSLAFIRTITRPIMGLVSVARRNMAGDLSATCGIRRDDEIGVLAEAFDTMVARLREHIENLEHRVAARTQELSDRADELEAANQQLQAFSHAASHDLKAPLRGIQSFATLLDKYYGERLDGDGAFFLSHIRRSANRMNELVDDLLAHARMEQHTFIIQPVCLPTAVRSALSERQEEIRQRGARIQLHLDPAMAQAEPQSLLQALRNLLENALKYSSQADETVIDIGCEQREEHCHLWVKDNGIGFDMAYHDRIFEIFQRLHTYDEYPGSGVGLALVKKAMDRVHGRVWAESSSGNGATFHLEFRAASSVTETDEAKAVAEAIQA